MEGERMLRDSDLSCDPGQEAILCPSPLKWPPLVPRLSLPEKAQDRLSGMLCDWLCFLILMLCCVKQADRILIFTTTELSWACQNTNAHFTPSANANGRALSLIITHMHKYWHNPDLLILVYSTAKNQSMEFTVICLKIKKGDVSHLKSNFKFTFLPSENL